MTTANALIQILAPAHMRGRLLAILLMTSFGAQPVTSLVVGFTAQALGAMVALRISGLVMFVGTVLLLAVRRGLWSWEVGPRVQHEQEAAAVPPSSTVADIARAS